MSKLLNGSANFGRLLLSLGMHRDWRASIAFLLFFPIHGTARAEVPVSVSAEGWTATANPDRGVFSASHEALGAVLLDASFDVRDSMGTHAVGKWTAGRGRPESVADGSVQSRHR